MKYWTLTKAVLLGAVLLAAGQATRELIRGSYWLQHPPVPTRQTTATIGWGGSSTSWQLKNIGLALHTYHEAYGNSFPPAGTFRADGTGLHSWITFSGPFMFLSFYFDDLHEDEPWNSPHNAGYFKSPLPDVTNPALPVAPTLDGDGFGLSHFAANVHVMGPNKSTSLDQITGGASHCLLVGEVSALFEPWGAPTNWRDPEFGINTSPRGFGSHPEHNGVLFLMADGGMRLINNDVDPEVLRRLSRPELSLDE